MESIGSQHDVERASELKPIEVILLRQNETIRIVEIAVEFHNVGDSHPGSD
jgi:hypothetical protein